MSTRTISQRPHRWITVPAGLLLFFSIGLPAFEEAHEQIVPITVPPAWPSYVLGMIAALAALSNRLQLAKIVLAGQILVWLMLGATAVMMVGVCVVPELGGFSIAAVLAVALLLVLVTGAGSFDELGAARVTIAAGFLGVAWFAALRMTRDDTMIGATLSLDAALALLVGGLEWRREISRDRWFPRATICRR